MKKKRFIIFDYADYEHKCCRQRNKWSEVDTVGSEKLSDTINRMISQGELAKFMREQSLNSFREQYSNPLTEEDISILNLKHLDRYEVDTAYNRLRARVLKHISDIQNAGKTVNSKVSDTVPDTSNTGDSQNINS